MRGILFYCIMVYIIDNIRKVINVFNWDKDLYKTDVNEKVFVFTKIIKKQLHFAREYTREEKK